MILINNINYLKGLIIAVLPKEYKIFLKGIIIFLHQY